MTFYILVFIAFNFVGDPKLGEINITQVSKLPYAFISQENCEDAFNEIREQSLTERFTHTCAPVATD